MSLYDPFAILGVSVEASEQEILQRYEFVASILAPDRLREKSERSRAFAEERLELVREVYQDLRQSRSKWVVQMRAFVVQTKPKPEGAIARSLRSLLKADVATIYRAAIADLAALQYSSRQNVIQITPRLGDLNLTYLSWLANPEDNLRDSWEADWDEEDNRDEGGAAVPRVPRFDPPDFGAEAKPDEGLSSVP